MKIISMSTFGVRCGIAEFTRSLNRALRDIDVEVLIFANEPSEKNPQDFLVADDAGFEVRRNWSVEGWSGQYDRPMLDSSLPPLVALQYESFLYSMKWFPALMREFKERGMAVVVTYHTAGVPPGFPAETVDLAICPTAEIARTVPGRRREVLEHPAPYPQPTVGTFGLGRAHVPWIVQACQELGWKFINMIHERGEWVTQERLLEDLSTCDVIALPYPPVGTSVSSAAVKVALASYRPVVVSDTNWFSTVPTDLVVKHAWNYEAFKAALQQALPAESFLRQRSWQKAAEMHKLWYSQLIGK